MAASALSRCMSIVASALPAAEGLSATTRSKYATRLAAVIERPAASSAKTASPMRLGTVASAAAARVRASVAATADALRSISSLIGLSIDSWLAPSMVERAGASCIVQASPLFPAGCAPLRPAGTRA